MISQLNVAYNGFGDPAQLSNVSPFELSSGYFTGAWRDGLQLEVKGYIGPTLAYDNTYTLSATAPSLLNFDYFGVTSVDFISSGGTHHPGYVPDGTQFVMDNLTVVPPVELSINKSGSNVIVSWSNGPGFILQAKSSLSPQTTWTNLGTQNPQTIPISAGARYFRVVSP